MQLPIQYLPILICPCILIEEPATRTTDCIFIIEITVVMKYMDRIYSFPVKKTLEFRRCRPPVIMISFQYDFPAWKTVQKMKVFRCAIKIHCPREIAANNANIVGAKTRKPVSYLIYISIPCTAEYFHGLVRFQREM